MQMHVELGCRAEALNRRDNPDVRLIDVPKPKLALSALGEVAPQRADEDTHHAAQKVGIVPKARPQRLGRNDDVSNTLTTSANQGDLVEGSRHD